MAIYSGSRYATSKILGIKNNKTKEVRKFVHHRKVYNAEDIGNASSVYTLKGDTELDFVSKKYYNKEEKFWYLADVNDIIFPLYDKELLGDNSIHIGTNVYIPSVQKVREKT